MDDIIRNFGVAVASTIAGITTVRIHIDRTAYESPNPTTGTVLYALANLGPHKELFREVEGDEEDVVVPRNGDKIHLKEDEHFYSEKVWVVIVNTEDKEATKRRLNFNDVVLLAYNPPPTGPNVGFTITYRKGPPQNPKGSMTETQSVRIKNGMIFDVTPTDRS